MFMAGRKDQQSTTLSGSYLPEVTMKWDHVMIGFISYMFELNWVAFNREMIQQ